MSAAAQEQSKDILESEKQKVIQSLEEDDEFEDFQAEGEYRRQHSFAKKILKDLETNKVEQRLARRANYRC